MEILQTIWTALTTENEVLVKILLVPLIFIEAYLIIRIVLSILNIIYTRNQQLTCVLCFSLISICTPLFIPSPWYTFINILSLPVLIYIIFKTTLLKSILFTAIPYVLSFVLSSLVISLLTLIFNINANSVVTVPLYRILCYSIYSYLLYLSSCIFRKFNFSIIVLDKFKTFNNRLIILNLIIGTVAIALALYIQFLYIDYIPMYLTLLSILILVIYFVISLYSLIRTNKLEITTQNLEEQQLYNKTLTILHDSIRGFKHDFGNIVQAIGGYIATNNIDDLKAYYNDLLEDCQKTNNLSVLNPEIINNPAIYSLLASKYYKADDLGIKINLEVLTDLNNLKIKTYDLTRILGILLDNAIEASSECEEKTINIFFRKDNKQNRDLVIVENTYENKNIDTEKIFEKGYTSKTEDLKSHGLGLWEVRKFLHKYNNLNLFTSKTKKYFKQQFELYN